MTTGEKSFNTAAAEKTKRNFDPVKPGIYDLKLIGDKSELRTAQPSLNKKTGKMSDPFPRISVRFTALNSATEEGGKDKLIFHDFYTSMVPDKGGVLAPTGADQLKGFADALGADADIPFALHKGRKVLSPKALLEWLKSHDGEVVSANISVQAGTKEYPAAKNKITEFIEPGGGDEQSEEGTKGLQEEGTEGLEEVVEEETPADDVALEDLTELEEEKPAPVVKKPAPKPAARPAAKPLAKKPGKR